MHHRLSGKFSKCPRRHAATEPCRIHWVVDVPEMVEQLVKLPKTVSEDGIQERTVEQTVDILFRKMWRKRQSSSRLPPRTGLNRVLRSRPSNLLLFSRWDDL